MVICFLACQIHTQRSAQILTRIQYRQICAARPACRSINSVSQKCRFKSIFRISSPNRNRITKPKKLKRNLMRDAQIGYEVSGLQTGKNVHINPLSLILFSAYKTHLWNHNCTMGFKFWSKKNEKKMVLEWVAIRIELHSCHNATAILMR